MCHAPLGLDEISLVDNGRLLPGVDLAVEFHLSKISVVVQDLADPVGSISNLPEFLAGFGSVFPGQGPGIIDDIGNFPGAVALEVEREDLLDDDGLFGVDRQLVRLFILDVPIRRATAQPLAPATHRAHFVLGTFADDLPFKLRERKQDVQRQAAHGRVGVELLGDGDKDHVVLIKELQQLAEVEEGTGEPVNLVDDHAVDAPFLDVGQQALEAGAFDVGSGEAAVVIKLFADGPAFMLLAFYIVLSGLALVIKGSEFLLQPFGGGFARVDRAHEMPFLFRFVAHGLKNK